MKYLMVLQTEDEKDIIECVERLSWLSSEQAIELDQFLRRWSKFFNHYISYGSDVYYACLPEHSLWCVRSNEKGKETRPFPLQQEEHAFSPYMDKEEECYYPRRVRKRVQLRHLVRKDITFTSLRNMIHADMITSILDMGDPPLELGGDARAYVTQVFLDAYQEQQARVPEFLLSGLISEECAEYIDVSRLRNVYSSESQ